MGKGKVAITMASGGVRQAGTQASAWRFGVLLRSCLVFAGCLVSSVFSYSWLAGNNLLDGLARFTAEAAGFLLSLSGSDVVIAGIRISSERFIVDVAPSCTGLVPVLLFICAVLAYPSRWSAKLAGILPGAACLFALNMMRIVSLFYTGVYFRRYYEVAHLVLWQTLLLLGAILLWLVWARRAGDVASR